MGIKISKSGRSRGTSRSGSLRLVRVSKEEYCRTHYGSQHRSSSRRSAPAAVPKPENARTDDEKQVLKVLEVNLKIEENAKNHHTDNFELTQEFHDGRRYKPKLVIRRGEPFNVSIKFDREFDKNRDDIKLLFDIGEKGQESRGTSVVLILSESNPPKNWSAATVSQKGDTIVVRINTPANLAVAKWNFHFDVILKKGEQQATFRYSHPDPIYILFNPWCTDDQVFLSDNTSRNEYVLNDSGRIFKGTKKQILSAPWNFGQFEDFVLDLCMYLFDNSGIGYRSRGDPVQIARKISALVNSPDDEGILVGNWSGSYTGGTPPFHWNGSVAILEKYWKTKQPVKFGQCWVFSGLVTTLCRAVGIPARSVTNFQSAHDTDGSVTIDRYWSSDGTPLEEFNTDSVWNFHVWNDVWMTRPDLPPGYGGWQAIDATPQETSEGVYCCGPASIEALKNGLVHLPYDGAFIFAEVNADCINKIQTNVPQQWAQSCESNAVGKNISTKGPQGNARLDITSIYKFAEGSQQERMAVERALKEGAIRKTTEVTKIKDIIFDLIEKDDSMYGEGFEVKLKMANKSSETANVKLTLSATVVYYNGIAAAVIKTATFDVKLTSEENAEVSLLVNAEDYMSKVVEMCHIKISCMALVKETNQFHCESDDFRLCKPTIDVKVAEEVKFGDEFEVEARFTNPLPVTLTKCEWQIEAAGMIRPLILKQSNVQAKSECKITSKLKASRYGLKEIIVGFDSKELLDLTGSTLVRVV